MALAVLAGCGAEAAPPDRVTARVMPLGDSITDGFTVPGGYRVELEDALEAARIDVDFVGSLANGPPALADRQHEGHNGLRIDQLASFAGERVAAQRLGVVLLLIGTNDMVRHHQLATAPQRLGLLIDEVVEAAPSAAVLVGSLPPLAEAPDDPGRPERVRAFNAAVPRIVARREAQGHRVGFVDLHEALTTADLADGVHPTAAGYARMAAVWSAAVRAAVADGSGAAGGTARRLADAPSNRASRRWDSNPRPIAYKAIALPAELLRPAIATVAPAARHTGTRLPVRAPG